MTKRNFLTLLLALSLSTANSQSSWTILNTGTNECLYGIDFFDDNNGIAVGDNGTIITTTDGGFSWTVLNSGVDNRLNAVSYINENQIIIAGNKGLILSTNDKGFSWKTVKPGSAGEADLLSVDMSVSGNGVIGGNSLTLLTTKDYGENWITVSKDGEGCYTSVKILDEVTAFAFGENSRSNNIIDKINNFRNLASGREYQVFNEKNYSPGRIIDGYPLSADSIVTVGMMYNPQGEQMSYIAKSEQWVSNMWLPVISNSSSFYTGLDMLDSYAIAVGGRYNAGFSGVKGYLISESYDKGKSWTDVSSPAEPYVLNDVDLQHNVAFIAGDCGLIMKAVLDSLPVSDHNQYHSCTISDVKSDYKTSCIR